MVIIGLKQRADIAHVEHHKATTENENFLEMYFFFLFLNFLNYDHDYEMLPVQVISTGLNIPTWHLNQALDHPAVEISAFLRLQEHRGTSWVGSEMP